MDPRIARCRKKKRSPKTDKESLRRFARGELSGREVFDLDDDDMKQIRSAAVSLLRVGDAKRAKDALHLLHVLGDRSPAVLVGFAEVARLEGDGETREEALSLARRLAEHQGQEALVSSIDRLAATAR